MPRADGDPDAFAETIAPVDLEPRAPVDTGARTIAQRPAATATGSHVELASDPTMAAPLTPQAPSVPGAITRSGMPLLPTVATDNYAPDREIARGGMGRIVAAEDRRLGRPVALKELIDPAPEHVGRFQREALITARLQHPGIVPVYEAGRWPSGEPFFAMKLVSGRPFDRVIAEAHTLDQRLALLPRIAAAADAIAYAHSQRIIHRDLKPGNVLIGEFGETVVIDWGLAKDLDVDDNDSGIGTRIGKLRPTDPPRTPRPPTEEPVVRPPSVKPTSSSSTMTIAGAVMGTPAYMAPEQARGEPVDQRADVFALGAMLYHLLSGTPPYSARSAADVVAAAALGKVTPLLQRERRAPADLVAIVSRAMAPLPIDRYPDAGELADELRRFLTGQLVGAHRYTAVQRVGRFVKRHRAAVTIAVIATIGFVVGGTMAVTRVVRARDLAEHERSVAIARGHAAEHLVDFMISDVKGRLSQIGRLDLLAGLGTEVRRYYDNLAQTTGGLRGDDTDRMAQAIEMVGLAELKSGKPEDAFNTWSDARRQVAASLEHDTAPPTRTRPRRRMLAQLDLEIGGVYQARGKTTEAIASYTAAKKEYDALKDEDGTDREVLLGAADTHDRLGDLRRTEGKLDEAYEEYAEARGERERASGQGNGRPSEEVLALSTSHVKLGSIHQARGESQAALDEYRAALKLRITLLDSQPDNVEIQEKVVDLRDSTADLQRALGDETAAIATYRDALPMIEALVRRDPENTTWKHERGDVLSDLGFALVESGAFKDGLDQLEPAIETQHELADRDPDNASWSLDLSRTYTRAGDAHLYLGEVDQALAQYELARDLRQHLVDKDPGSVPYRRSLAWAHAKLANAYQIKGDVARALSEHEGVLELRKTLADEAPAQGGFKNELASTEVTLGQLIIAKDAARSAQLITAGLGRARALVAADMINLDWKETLVQGLLAQADGARATSDVKARKTSLAEALEVAEAAAHRAPQNAHWPGFVAEAHVGLAEVATAEHDAAVAAAEWKAARDVLEPMAKAGRLPAQRRPLLDRARAAR